jgi:hypothetical protein
MTMKHPEDINSLTDVIQYPQEALAHIQILKARVAQLEVRLKACDKLATDQAYIINRGCQEKKE